MVSTPSHKAAWLVLVCCLPHSVTADVPSVTGSMSGWDPAVLLVRDPRVLADLQIAGAQRGELQEFLQQIDPRLWVLRDATPRDAAAFQQLQDRLREFQVGLTQVLRPEQRERLQQLVLQAQGVQALRDPEFVQRLGLSDSQRRETHHILDQTAEAVRKLQLAQQQDPPLVAEQITQLRTDEQQQLLTLLTPDQQNRWVELRGRRLDLSALRSTGFYPPQLPLSQEWIHSEPIRFSELRGRVVVVHFWTFGCINCIHNYPAYKTWHQDFSQRGVMLIGIHTPETEGERDVARIRQKAAENELRFPIVVDNQRQNWDAWANRVWPSVYLIDKRGRVRYWWYGELNWETAQGEQWMRARIEALLAEKDRVDGS